MPSHSHRRTTDWIGSTLVRSDGVSQDETGRHAGTRCDAEVEPTTTFVQVAQLVAGLGALGLLTATLNLFALRVVRIDEVPVCVQPRIRWWSHHNPAVLLASAGVTVAGLVMMAAA